ncbi:GTP diphosphokinase [Inmirania thermothiophila]|uniref:GTP pyrophosphokinase n=1 Tax=Inmirania thermothiophila TaxID=1750597 RepID=A0A3N1YBY4_9GAMM|nr:GTP diphosphokinase [Inmirania thermothiophila]ROR34897.1 GTP pyrophosphokinase [Inmirania thermothiophila]
MNEAGGEALRPVAGLTDLAARVSAACGHWPAEEHRRLRAVLRHLDARTGAVAPAAWGRAHEVASVLAALHADAETVGAALLHVLLGADADRAAVREALGEGMVRLLDGAGRMGQVAEQRAGTAAASAEQAEALRKMLLAMVEDVRVVLLVLALRLVDLRHAAAIGYERRRALARETMDIYAPLANRLGIWQLKWELEDLAFRYLEPLTYRRLAQQLAERRADRERYLREVTAQLGEALAREGIEADIAARPKHLYSIWKKMQRKGVGFEEIFDVRAVRVLVAEVAQCYAVLGIVHSLWHPIPREFDDYIARPKPNNYRSLHTAVVGPEGRTLEVQIRTHEMHRQAELGIAAHWRYKEGVRFDPGVERKVAWLRQLLAWREEVADGGEFVDQFRAATQEERVYVFTPRGEVVDLPAGATVLDFAYHIHTEVGHRCRGAKVNGRIVPLTHELATGEQVEILTAKAPRPSRDWLSPHLGYLRTARARAKVRHWFKQLDREENIAAGRAVLEREAQRLGVTVEAAALCGRLRQASEDDLLAAVGRGEISAAQVAAALAELGAPPGGRDEPVVAVPRRRGEGGSGEVRIAGVGDLLAQTARCCKPLPGDPVRGYITRGRGVSIHHRDCRNLARLALEDPDRVITVDWQGAGPRRRYPVDVRVRAYDRPGLLRDVTALLAAEHVEVEAARSTGGRRRHETHLELRLHVGDMGQLARVLARIGELPNVLDVRRVGAAGEGG